MIIAAMGLFALTTFVTEQRTREIGVLKAMGAATWDIVRLLPWQFSRPVLIAAAVALPVSYLLMGSWLQRFATRVDTPDEDGTRVPGSAFRAAAAAQARISHGGPAGGKQLGCRRGG